jgi:hypothetical protein
MTIDFFSSFMFRPQYYTLVIGVIIYNNDELSTKNFTLLLQKRIWTETFLKHLKNPRPSIKFKILIQME